MAQALPLPTTDRLLGVSKTGRRPGGGVPDMDLSLDVGERNGFTVLAVHGEVDVYTAPRLRERLVELVSQGKRQIVVDLGAVDFLDSTGLGVLVGGLKRLRSHDGDLTLVCTQQRILKVFEITGLTKVWASTPPVYPTTRRSPIRTGSTSSGGSVSLSSARSWTKSTSPPRRPVPG